MSVCGNAIDIREVYELLGQAYGKPECRPEYGPLDELVLTILSQSTTAANYNRAFGELKRRFPRWEDVRRADVSQVEDAIRSGGLARMKAPRIKRLLDDIHARHGGLNLDFLYEWSDTDARDYLMQFEGVGIKTASCVLMFSMCRPVFPVDTHIHRISQRFGWIDSSVSAEAAHDVIQSMITDDMVYALHVNLVTHGRRVCKARNPACDVCMLLECCPWGQKALAAGGM